MNIVLRSLGAVFIFLFLTIGLAWAGGLEPKDQRPGLWLKGNLVEVPVIDWSFTDSVKEIHIETKTRYFIPHSVTTYSTTHSNQFYIMSAYYEGGSFPNARGWNRNIVRDPRVRIKVGRQLFDRTASYISDESIRESVYQSFVSKYPEWASPGIENVHLLLVGPAS